MQDLCARLPYRVKVGIKNEYLTDELINEGYNEPLEIYGVESDNIPAVSLLKGSELLKYSIPINGIKPYLFPMSSMTDEQRLEIEILTDGKLSIDQYSIWDYSGYGELSLSRTLELIQWCYENHFDINGLIGKKLAIDATDKNIY